MITTDPKDPRLGSGVDTAPVPQNAAYLVLSEVERAKGFVRPVRTSYIHVGPIGPRFPLRASDHPVGRYWTNDELAKVGKGCGAVTTMATAIAETYARNPHFYGSTYCVRCQMHLPVQEFVWDGTDDRVGS